MVTITEAKQQISQARQTIQERQQESQKAQQQLRDVKSKLPDTSSQKFLRRAKNSLLSRLQRGQIQKVEKEISQRQISIEGFKQELGQAEQDITSYESQVLAIESQIKQQKQNQADYERGLSAGGDVAITSDDPYWVRKGREDVLKGELFYQKQVQKFKDEIIAEGGTITSFDSRTGKITYNLPDSLASVKKIESRLPLNIQDQGIKGLSSIPEYSSKTFPLISASQEGVISQSLQDQGYYVSTTTGQVLPVRKINLPDWVERSSFKISEVIRKDPFLSRIFEPSKLGADVKRITPQVYDFFKSPEPTEGFIGIYNPILALTTPVKTVP